MVLLAAWLNEVLVARGLRDRTSEKDQCCSMMLSMQRCIRPNEYRTPQKVIHSAHNFLSFFFFNFRDESSLLVYPLVGQFYFVKCMDLYGDFRRNCIYFVISITLLPYFIITRFEHLLVGKIDCIITSSRMHIFLQVFEGTFIVYFLCKDSTIFQMFHCRFLCKGCTFSEYFGLNMQPIHKQKLNKFVLALKNWHACHRVQRSWEAFILASFAILFIAAGTLLRSWCS